MIEVAVESVRVSQQTNRRVVILKERLGERHASIWVGQFEAECIAYRLQGTAITRPLPYDLMGSILASTDAAVARVLVTEMRDDIFYATVELTRGGQMIPLDARPSDAINLAIRIDAPIFVSESLLFTMEQFRAMEADSHSAQPVPTQSQRVMQNLDFAEGLTGWFLTGSRPGDYATQGDEAEKQSGTASGALRSTGDAASGFGTLMQWAEPGDLTGKRVRMTGVVRSESVVRWAGLWLRIDGVDAHGTRISLGFDNMQNRAITGATDWTVYDLVLDVPTVSTAIAFGILLDGPGAVWLDHIAFSIVGEDVPVTNISSW